MNAPQSPPAHNFGLRDGAGTRFRETAGAGPGARLLPFQILVTAARAGAENS